MNTNYSVSPSPGAGFTFSHPNGLIVMNNNSRVTFNFINSAGPPPPVSPPNYYWPTGIPGNVYSCLKFSFSQTGYSQHLEQHQYGPHHQYSPPSANYHLYYPGFPTIGNGIRQPFNGYFMSSAGSSMYSPGDYLVTPSPSPVSLDGFGGSVGDGDSSEYFSTISSLSTDDDDDDCPYVVEQSSREDPAAPKISNLFKPIKKQK